MSPFIDTIQRIFFWAGLVIVVGWMHFYLLPQYIITFIQNLFNDKDVIFYFKNYRTTHDGKAYVALTIDDSPTTDTEAILAVLKKHDVKATFFVISSYVKGRESIISHMLKEGHEIANHLTKDEPSWKLPDNTFSNELLTWERDLKRWLKFDEKTEKLKWFRPGHAIFTPSMLKVLKERDYKIALANVYPSDANNWKKCQSDNPLLNSWYLRARVRPGAIIVVHDRPWTIEALDLSLKYLVKDFHLTTLSDCANNLL